MYLYPFLNTINKARPFEYLRLTSLGVIGALVKVRVCVCGCGLLLAACWLTRTRAGCSLFAAPVCHSIACINRCRVCVRKTIGGSGAVPLVPRGQGCEKAQGGRVVEPLCVPV